MSFGSHTTKYGIGLQQSLRMKCHKNGEDSHAHALQLEAPMSAPICIKEAVIAIEKLSELHDCILAIRIEN